MLATKNIFRSSTDICYFARLRETNIKSERKVLIFINLMFRVERFWDRTDFWMLSEVFFGF